jgi:hypothetical protein
VDGRQKLGACPRTSVRIAIAKAGLTPHQGTKHKRERNNESTRYPAVIEPKCVDPRPLRVRLRVGNRNGITCRQPDNRLPGRIDDAVQVVARILELKYRVDLPGSKPLESDDRTLYVSGIGRGAPVAAVEHRSGENEDRRERERQHQAHVIPPTAAPLKPALDAQRILTTL